MSALNFQQQYRGIKGCQGTVISGLTATSTYQTQYHAPIDPIYRGLPNGRIVYVGANGYLSPVLPVSGATKFAMPMLLAEGGANIATVPITYAANSGTPLSEAPYMTAIPQPNPNLLALPMCSGYEFLSTEYDGAANYTYNQALTSETDANAAGLNIGRIKPLTAATEMCIGFVSRTAGQPRVYGDPTYFVKDMVPGLTGYPPGMTLQNMQPVPDNPNPMVSVTGKNMPGLSFWGCPMPIGAVTN